MITLSIPIPFLQHCVKIYIQRNKHESGPPCEPSDTPGLSAWCLESERAFSWQIPTPDLLLQYFDDPLNVNSFWWTYHWLFHLLSCKVWWPLTPCLYKKERDWHIYTLMTEHPAGHRLAACRGSISSNMVPHSSSNTLRCYLLLFIYRRWILYNIIIFAHSGLKIEWEFEVKSVKPPVEKQKRTQNKRLHHHPSGAIHSWVFWQRLHHSMQFGTLCSYRRL